GAIGIGGALVLVAAAIYNVVGGWPRPFVLADVLIDTWLVAGAGYVVTRVAGMLAPRSDNPAPTGSLLDDVSRFTETVASRKNGRFLGTLSLVLPAIAISLLTPLTLHLGFWSLMENHASNLSGFDEWILMSLTIVGHAHLALAGLATRFALGVSRMPLTDL